MTRRLLAIVAVMALPGLAQAETIYVLKQNITTLAGYSINIVSPRGVGVPLDSTSRCVANAKLYAGMATSDDPTKSAFPIILETAVGGHQPGDRLFLMQNTGDETTVVCGGQNFLQINASKHYWLKRHKQDNTNDPTERLWMPAAHNGGTAAASSKTYMFGGSNPMSGGVKSDLWYYKSDTSSWTQVTQPKTKPAARAHHGMVWTGTQGTTSGKLVLFGGQTSSSLSQETWTWQEVSNIWTKVPSSCKSTTCPSARKIAPMAYSPTLSKIVLFGGDNNVGGVVLTDTWTYNFTNWTNVATGAATPPGRAWAASTFVPTYVAGGTTVNMNKVVMFGGQYWPSGNLTAMSDMWTFNGTGWTAITFTAGSGPSLYGHGMSWDTTDAANPRLVVYGGAYTNATYEYTNPYTYYFTLNTVANPTSGTWSKETPPVSTITPRFSPALAHDKYVNRKVFFGGGYNKDSNGDQIPDTIEMLRDTNEGD